MGKKWYAVRVGRTPGIYETWDECRKQVDGYSGSEFKSFNNPGEAGRWLKGKLDSTQKQHSEKRKINQKTTKKRKDSEKICPECLNEEQRKAYDFMQTGNNIFLTGEAGTGKSFLLQCFIENAKGKNVIVCAPTGIAALQVHGATIHKTFRLKTEPILPDKNIGKVRDVIKAADVIIIDEISMCRFDLFDYVCRYIMKAEQISGRKKQVIVVGDFCQLPPIMKGTGGNLLAEAWKGRVENPWVAFAFIAPGWKAMNFFPIVLKEVMRQKDDQEFLNHLNRIRTGDKGAIEWFNSHTAEQEQRGIFLYGTNVRVDEKNKQAVAELKGKPKTYYGQNDNFEYDLPVSMEISLCVGTRVMTIVNDAEGKYQNGSLGTVAGLKNESVEVLLDNGRKTEIVRYTWYAVDYHVVTDEKTGEQKIEQEIIGTCTQLPLKIAFAITIHKSQGQTYDSANLDPACFSNGQLYVALSRVTSAKKLHLLRKITDRDLRVSYDVKHFYDSICATEEKV